MREMLRVAGLTCLILTLTLGGVCEAKENRSGKIQSSRAARWDEKYSSIAPSKPTAGGGILILSRKRQSISSEKGARDVLVHDGANRKCTVFSRSKVRTAGDLSNKKRIMESKASWYSSEDSCGKETNDLPGCPTASGKSLYTLEAKGILFCAVNKGTHRIGSRIKVSNISGGRWVEVAVLDTGNLKKYKRSVDLCKAAFEKLAPLEKGIVNVKIEEVKK